MATWKELKAQGVRRCCVMFKSGKQCRKRAVAEFDHSWCVEHGPTMKAQADYVNGIIRQMQNKG